MYFDPLKCTLNFARFGTIYYSVWEFGGGNSVMCVCFSMLSSHHLKGSSSTLLSLKIFRVRGFHIAYSLDFFPRLVVCLACYCFGDSILEH